MGGKAKAKPAEEKGAGKEGEGAPDTPLPLLDLTDAGVKKMIKAAKKRGYVTLDQINEVMPSGEVSSAQIEDIYGMLSEMGINVVANEDAGEDNDEKAEEAPDDDEEDTGSDIVEAKSKSLDTTGQKKP